MEQPLQASFKQALEMEESRLTRLERFVEENDRLIDTLTSLPQKTRHNIMVPFGSVAFFPGQMIHTNELLVHIGDQYYAERSTSEALEILERRGSSLSESVTACQEEVHVLRGRLDVATSLHTNAAPKVRGTRQTDTGTVHEVEGEDGATYMEIREEFETSEHMTVPAVQAPDRHTRGDFQAKQEDEEEDIMKRLEELEMEEEAAEEEAMQLDSDDEDDEEGQPHLKKNGEAPVSGSCGDEARGRGEEGMGGGRGGGSLIKRATVTDHSNVGTTSVTTAPQRKSDSAKPDHQPPPHHSTPQRVDLQELKEKASRNVAFTGQVSEKNASAIGGSQTTGAPRIPSNKPLSRFKQMRQQGL